MENATQLANRFREVLLSGKWIANTNFKLALQDLEIEQATKEIATLNTIAALTYHINYYIAGVLNVFKGGALEIRDKYSFDLPELQSNEDWKQLFEDLMTNAEQFAQHVEQLSEEQLDANFVDEKYGSYRRNIEGMIEHAYYHLGQVILLKKLVLE